MSVTDPIEQAPEGWELLDQWASGKLRAELFREMAGSHPLFGKDIRVIARRSDSDDILVSIDGQRHRFAIVQLTWEIESSSDLPEVRFFDGIEEIQGQACK